MKYKILRMFFDADEIACVYLEDAISLYPKYKEELENMSWDIDDIDVLAVSDMQDIIDEL